MRILTTLFCLPLVFGLDIQVQWYLPHLSYLPSRTVSIGDTMIFQWNGLHDVFIHPSGNCHDDTGAIPVGGSSGAEYTFTEADVGTLYFMDAIAFNCENGMLMQVTVENVHAIAWFIPPTFDSLPARTATVGDTFKFNWAGIHNVAIHPSNDCSSEEDDAILISEESGAEYTFTSADVGEVLFVCDIYEHCEHGMKMTVTVQDQEERANVIFNPACFSGATRVQVKDKGWVEMPDLEIGDQVLVSDQNKFEPIYSFGHRRLEESAEYLQVHTDGTDDPLELSGRHLILRAGNKKQDYVPADALQVGDTLTKGDGSSVMVTKIRSVTRKGIFAPFTASGSIVVNDIVSSTYISLQEGSGEYLKIGDFETPFTFQWLSHTFERGHLLACTLFMDCEKETYTESGYSHWAARPYQFANWLLQQHAVLTTCLLMPVVPIFGFLWLLKSPLWTFTALGAFLLARSGLLKDKSPRTKT